MKPGIYKDLDFPAYQAIPAVNASRLKYLDHSPAHYKAAKDGLLDRKETRTLLFGNLVHAGVMEALSIVNRYVVMPEFEKDNDNRTATGRKSDRTTTGYVIEKRREFMAQHPGKTPVSRAEYDTMAAMVAAIHRDDLARSAFEGPGEAELTIVWEDDETGILCKGRIDWMKKFVQMSDLKTTQSVSDFSDSVRKFKYYRQQAFYRDGWAALTGELLPCWLVAIEKTPPYCVAAAPLCDAALEQGVAEYREHLRTIAECEETDRWPSKPAPDAWTLPEWYQRPVELKIAGQTVGV